jgi:hypothetical protein
MTSAAFPLRLGLDTVAADGFLGFLDGALVVAFSQLAALLVGNGVERYELRTVVLVAVLLF